MSIAPVSYRDKAPILFTTKDGNTINGYSKKSGVNYVVIGGNKVVSDSLVKKYGATRLEGRTRYETNKAVLDRYYPNRDIAYFTNGDTLVDALSSVHMTKDQGIVLVNHKNNHDLLKNINTYQIGGIKGYDFKYKDEKGKLLAVNNLKAKKKTPVNNASTKDKVYKHKINIDNVTGTYMSKPTENMKKVMNALKNRKEVLYMSDKEFKEVKDIYRYSYTSLPVMSVSFGGNEIFLVYDEDYNRRLDEYFSTLDLYKAEIKRALSGMNLNCSNEEMVRQINLYISKNYSYKIIDGRPIDMIKNYEGQCMHYAMLFNNMCAAVGIDMDYVVGKTESGGDHAWNRGVFDGQMYYFDLTYETENGSIWVWFKENFHGEITEVY